MTVERDRAVLPGWLRSLYDALEEDGCLIHLEKLKEAADEIERLRAALRSLVEAKALKEVEGIVAGWNGPDKDNPNPRHPSQLGATIRTNCKGMYDLADVLAKARTALGEPKP